MRRHNLIMFPGAGGGGGMDGEQTLTDRIKSMFGSSIIGYWPLSEASGAVAQDISGNNLHGAYSAAGITYGQSGIGDGKTSVKFNGATGVINLYSTALNAAFNGQEFSLGIAFKVPDVAFWADATNRRLFSIQVDGNSYFVCNKATTAGRITWSYNSPSVLSTANVENLAMTGWTFWWFSSSKIANKVRVWIEGVEQTPSNNIGSWSGNLGVTTMVLGARNTVPEFQFNGYEAHAILLNRPVTDVEMLQHRTLTAPYYGWAGGINLDSKYAPHASTYCVTPSYDSSGQGMHPAIYDAGLGNTWNGHRYWMAETPYTNSSAQHENPSILVSEDGLTWSVPVGLTNPLVTPPVDNSFYSDPDLLLVGSTMYVLYRYVPNDQSRLDIIIRSSTDGVTWSAETVIITSANISLITSPSIIYDGTQFVLFARDNVSGLNRRTCVTINGTWSAAATIPIPVAIASIWHLRVVFENGLYYMIWTDGDNELGLGSSYNGIYWLFANHFLLTKQATGWDNGALYQAGLVKTSTGFDIWYSATGADGWHIGKTSC